MTAMDSQTYVRRRKRKRAEHDEEIPHFQGSLVEDHSLKEEKGDPIVEDESAKRLINLELDVAEALAEFWRMAREPSRQGKFNVHLRWSRKRLRSSLFTKDSIAPCKPKEEPEDAISSAKNRSCCLSERDSSFSDKDEIESSRMSKDSSQFDSRAESPSSPLPSVQLPCRSFLPGGSPAAKSAFQRVLPLQRPCLIPVKSEIEDMQLEHFDVRPQNASGRRKAKSSKCAMSKATLKEVPSGEQTIDFRHCRGAASPEDLKVKSEVCWVTDLTVFNKPKPALNDEKEARRLRRIEANRESARQTIRRKQVVCEELMKKASSLSFENEGMKQKRESLMQELFCLRGQNYHLKQQLGMEASANLGLEPAEIALKTLSESVSLPAFQVSSLPYAGVPVHCFAWAMAAAQAAAANPAYTFINKEKPSDAIQTNLCLPQQAAALASPAMNSGKETSVLRTVEQSLNHAFNGVCSSALMEKSPQKDMGCATSVCTEICTLQSQQVTCDLCSSATPVADPCSTIDPQEELAFVQSNCLSSQPPSLVTCGTKAGFNTMPAVAIPHESMEGYLGPQIAQGVRCGYTHHGGRGGHCLIAHSQTNTFTGRNHFSVMAAAEARKRRKELTRHKFSRSRTLRPALQAGNTKEI